MAKTVDISFDSIKEGFSKMQAWLTNFFNTIDTNELIAVGVIGLGFILFIVGLLLL